MITSQMKKAKNNRYVCPKCNNTIFKNERTSYVNNAKSEEQNAPRYSS